MASSLYLVEIGHYAAYLALVVAVVQASAPLAAHLLRAPSLGAIGMNAAVAVFALTSIGGAALIHAFVSSGVTVAYVAQHSNLQLPLFY